MSVEPMNAEPGFVARRPAGLRLTLVRDYGIVASFALLFVVLTLSSSAFLTSTNLLNILDQWSPTLIIAVASTIVFVAGGFDLSVGSVYALAGVTAALLTPDVGVVPALAIGVAAGAVCGVVNGLLVTVGRINAFIATLATSMMIVGLAYLLTRGDLISVSDPGFSTLGAGEWLGVSYAIWICVGVVVLCGVLLGRTVFGRFAYATGGNPEAARLSGINVTAVRTIAFTLSGACAALAGVIVASRVSTGQADAGGLTLAIDAVTGIVIGGTSILGGAGAIWRTVLGVLLLALLGNGFNLLGLNATDQQIVKGAIVLLAVAVDAWARTAKP